MFKDTESKMLRVMFKFERRNFQEFREDYMRKSFFTYTQLCADEKTEDLNYRTILANASGMVEISN